MDSVLIKPKTVRELYSETAKAKGFVIVEGYDEKVNRAAVESKKINMLLNPERCFNEDKMHYRLSGLNDVLCKLASKNKVAIGIDFEHLKKLNENERINALGKVMQNVSLCNKYNVKQYIVYRDNKNEKDLKCFGLLLGMKNGGINLLKC